MKRLNPLAGNEPSDIASSFRSQQLELSRRVALQFVARVRQFARSGAEETDATPVGIDYYLANPLCVNCDRKCDRTYCSDLCKQEAATVRYVRRVLADARMGLADIQEGIGAKLLMISGGGYPDKERELSPSARAKIFARDNNTCRLCGRTATQIDHIQGSSSDPSNLQSLCADCNRNKAFAGARMVGPESDNYSLLQARFDSLARRVGALRPLRLCDDESSWTEAELKLRSVRRKNPSR